MRFRTSVTVAAALVLGALVAAPGVASGQGVKNNPENKRLPPSANAGYFLGYPMPTYSWHGCTATATAVTLSARTKPIAGEPRTPKGTKQGAVSLVTTLGAPFATWQAKRGWTICGVQVSAVLENPEVDAHLLAQIGYRSGATRGSTATNGQETLRVPISRRAIGTQFARFEGKVFTIHEIRSVVVYVKSPTGR